MNDKILEIAGNIGLITDLFPFVVLFIVIGKVHHKMWWTLFFISFGWIASNQLAGLFADSGINNHIIFNIHALFSTFLYLYLFVQLNDSRIYRRLVGLTLIIYEFTAIFALFYCDGWYSHAPIIDIFTGIIPLILSMLFFYDLFKSLREPNLLAYPYYWINSAIMVHFGVSFFSYIFFGVFSKNYELFSYIWLFVLFSNIIYNILFARGLWLMKRT